MKRVLRPLAGEQNELPILPGVTVQTPWPQFQRPSFGLEAWVQLPDVMQERKRGDALAIHLCQFAIRRCMQAAFDNGLLQ